MVNKYLGHVLWVSLGMVHVGPIEGPFCETVTSCKNASQCNFYSTDEKIDM